MLIILRIFYIVITYLLIPVVFLHLIWKGLGNRDYWRRIGERFGFYELPPLKDVIWVHAVSVGEVQAAASLIRALLRDYPYNRVLVTTTTPTGSDRVRALFGDDVVHCYTPQDVGWSSFNRALPSSWRLNCGRIFSGSAAPAVCRLCWQARAYHPNRSGVIACS